MDPLDALATRIALASVATATATGALAWLARRWSSERERWPVVRALLLGSEGSEASAPTSEAGDLRFAAVTASVAAGVTWVLALDSRLRELPPGSRAIALAVGFPVVALVVTTLADLVVGSSAAVDVGSGPYARSGGGTAPASPVVGRAVELARSAGFSAEASGAIGTAVRVGEVAANGAALFASNPQVQAVAGAAAQAALRGGRSVLQATAALVTDAVVGRDGSSCSVNAVHGDESPEAVRVLIARTENQIGRARKVAQGDEVRDALDSMAEALAGYSAALNGGRASVAAIAEGVREVSALARRTADDAVDAFSLMGLRRDASAVEARELYRELVRIYHADAHRPGVDPGKLAEIEAAYQQVQASLAA